MLNNIELINQMINIIFNDLKFKDSKNYVKLIDFFYNL